MTLSLQLPIVQNWSCHSCGSCCRNLSVEVTDSERERIVQQGWTEADSAPRGDAAFEKMSGSRYRLAHRVTGECVFLDEHNRCRIHEKFGAAAKPLACRVYPFQFHPSGNGKIAISVRFDCPSAAANRGESLSSQRSMLHELRDLVVPESAGAQPPPDLSPTERLDWPDTLRVIDRLRKVVTSYDDRPLALRLVHALFVTGMLSRATFDKVRGDRLDELLDVLTEAAPAETSATIESVPVPSTLARTQFRLIAAQYTRRDTTADRGWRYRLSMVAAAWRFTRGTGNTPAMQETLPPVPFDALERPHGGRRREFDLILSRYFDVKLSGMAFCGPACHDLPVTEGVQNLVLVYPLTMYIARWLAVSQKTTTLEIADVERALSIVDHPFGYSPMMARSNFRRRVNWLAQDDEIARLIAWYSQ